jgi:calcineurin-like phosphoesterase
MPTIRAAFIGDIVGKAGRNALAHALPILRRDHHADTVIANAENARHGRGPNPATYNDLVNTPAGGPDALTLGDHALDDPTIKQTLADPASIIARPWRMPGFTAEHRDHAVARISKRSPLAGKQLPPLIVVTVLGRAFMTVQNPPEFPHPFALADDAVDTLARKHPDALFIIEVHAEATSEKSATAHHCAMHHQRRVVAVVGTHTHCQTNDPRIIPFHDHDDAQHALATPSKPPRAGVAAISDLGCTAPELSVIGFNPAQSIERLKNQQGQIHPAESPATTRAAIIDIDTDQRAATAITAVNIPPPE